jgi:hypothetical protein
MWSKQAEPGSVCFLIFWGGGGISTNFILFYLQLLPPGERMQSPHIEKPCSDLFSLGCTGHRAPGFNEPGALCSPCHALRGLFDALEPETKRIVNFWSRSAAPDPHVVLGIPRCHDPPDLGLSCPPPSSSTAQLATRPTNGRSNSSANSNYFWPCSYRPSPISPTPTTRTPTTATATAAAGSTAEGGRQRAAETPLAAMPPTAGKPGVRP